MMIGKIDRSVGLLLPCVILYIRSRHEFKKKLRFFFQQFNKFIYLFIFYIFKYTEIVRYNEYL